MRSPSETPGSALAVAAGVSRPTRVEGSPAPEGRPRAGRGERVLPATCSLDTIGVQPLVEPGYELPAPGALTLRPSGVAVLGAASPAVVDEGSDARA